jgi:DNA polymerase/3'-5' exonuclease PolX
VLTEISDLLEIEGGNAFKIRSYRLSAESVEHHGA